MKALHVMFGVLLFVLLFALAGGGLYVARTTAGWGAALDFLRHERLAVLGLSAILALLVVLFLLTTARRRTGEPFVTFENEGGQVSVSARAIAEHIGRVGDEFAAVLDLKPVIEAARGTMGIVLDLRVRGGTQIPELCRMVQERVRDTIRDSLGVTEIRGIRVNVREIVTAPGERKKADEAPA